MGWSFNKEFQNITDEECSIIKISGSSISDTIVLKKDNHEIEMHIDAFQEIVNYIDFKTNFLNE